MTSSNGPGAGGRPLTRLESNVPDGGDAACWLTDVCPHCNAFNDRPIGAPCWNCGLTPDEPGPGNPTR